MIISHDILEAVYACPVLLGKNKNEIDEDCEGCAVYDPDRAFLCRHLQQDRPIGFTRDLDVFVDLTREHPAELEQKGR